jgi:hypothetical protein
VSRTRLPIPKRTASTAGEQLNYVGLNVRNRAHAYIGSAKRCGACSQKAQCTTGRYKYLAIHIIESARQRARELANTPEFSTAQRQRKKVEALFAELKHQIGLRRLRLAPESGQSLCILGYLIGQKLQSHKAVQPRILGFVDHTHPTAAQFLNDAVVRDGLADQMKRTSSSGRNLRVDARASQRRAGYMCM